MAVSRLERRTTFGEEAELYDRVRPGFPDRVFDDLVSRTGVHAGSRVLEVGCGTGQATVPLARRGFRVTAVELSPALARVARRNLRPFPNARVVTGAFESVSYGRRRYALLVFANAFHWIEPAVRLPRVEAVLAPGGWVAVLHHHHVAGGTREFFRASQKAYRRFIPKVPPTFRLPGAGAVEPYGAVFAVSGGFSNVTVRRYAWTATYRTQEYLDLLRTYSDHRALGERGREALLAELGQLIDTRFGGRIRKRYVTELTMAQRAHERAPEAVGGGVRSEETHGRASNRGPRRASAQGYRPRS